MNLFKEFLNSSAFSLFRFLYFSLSLFLSLFLFLTLSPYIQYVLIEYKYNKENFYKSKLRIKIEFCRILHNHSCEYVLTKKKQKFSAEQWTYMVLRCKNLVKNDIESVVCHNTCINPCSKKPIRELKSVPVKRVQTIVTIQGNRKLQINIPVACKCISTLQNESQKCRRNNSNRRS